MARKKPPTPEPPQPPESVGGVGGPRRPSGRASLASLRLDLYAINQRWPVSEALKSDAAARVGEILKDGKAGARSHVAAARVAVSMTSANLAAVDCAVRTNQAGAVEERLADVERRLDESEPGGNPQ